jgi:hypothetical protein
LLIVVRHVQQTKEQVCSFGDGFESVELLAR